MNDFALWNFAIDLHGVDKKISRLRCQLLNGVQHRQARGMVNIDLVDAGGIHRGDGPRDGMFADADGEFFATFRGQEFRIAQTANAVGGIEDHSGRHDRAEERSAADLIDSGNQLCA